MVLLLLFLKVILLKEGLICYNHLEETDMKKVLIIGAGPAGLTAAYELLDKSQDYEVIVFEESDDSLDDC